MLITWQNLNELTKLIFNFNEIKQASKQPIILKWLFKLHQNLSKNTCYSDYPCFLVGVKCDFCERLSGYKIKL